MMKRAILLFSVLFSSLICISAQDFTITRGSLDGFSADGKQLGEFPLKHTDVKVEISGSISRVKVTQEFENNFNLPIEAVYVFPLSQNSAVDEMTMKVGERIIRGQIMKREEAEKVYEEAKSQGKTASLLNQERPNVFTQSVANIQPGERILIEISYVETLKFEDGEYEFVFPMVVAPRYLPGSSQPQKESNISRPADQMRSGSEVSIEVNLDAGVPIESIRSTLHEIEIINVSPRDAKIRLKDIKTIPNKDFVLRYDVTGKRIEDAVLIHKSELGGFFSLILSPPQDFDAKDITPKEIVFVLDTSGSMNGFPIEKAKEAMRLSLEGLHPNDKFNLITFAGETSVLFENPVSATPLNLRLAKSFLDSKRSSGGTEMMNAIRAAFKPSGSKKHIRIVCFMTDGLVGNEAEIISEVQNHPEARVFSFGIGNSVNRYLLDKIASEGLGETEYVSHTDDGEKAAKRFYERVRTPLLTDIKIDWNGLAVDDVYPKRIADLFSAKTLTIFGRYKHSAVGSIKLKGKVGGQVFEREIAVTFPESEPDHDVLSTIWARKNIDELSMEYIRAKTVDEKSKIEALITELGLKYRILTDYTSFVAVEDMIVNQNGKIRRETVPLQNAKRSNNSSDPHGFLYSATNGRRNERSGSVQGMARNEFASVVGLELSTIVDGKRVVLGDEPKSANNANANLLNSVPEEEGRKSPLNEILTRIETHRQSLLSLRATVQINRATSGAEEIKVNEGTVICVMPKNGKSLFRIDWEKPSKIIFVILEDKYLIYEPNSKTLTTDKIVNKNINSLAFLTWSKTEIETRYIAKLHGTEVLSDGIATWHLELTPKGAEDFKSIELWIDVNGMPVQAKFVIKADEYLMIRLSAPQKNIAVKASEFMLNIPKDTAITKRD